MHGIISGNATFLIIVLRKACLHQLIYHSNVVSCPNTMSVIKVFEGKNFAFILPHFIESKKLWELRTQLTRDGFNLSNYQFIFGGVRVSTPQENTLSLEAVATQESNTGDCRKIFRVQIIGFEKNTFIPNEPVAVCEEQSPRKRNYQPEAGNISNACEPVAVKAGRFEQDVTEIDSDEEGPSTSSFSTDPELENPERDQCESEEGPHERLQEQEQYQTPKHVKPTINSFLRSPKPWEAKGIKIYDLSEVESAHGYEKARREFWNKEAKKLSCSKLSREEIAMKINQNWRKEKVAILENEFETIVSSGEDAGPSKSLKKKTLEKNMARIKNLETEILTVEEEISRKKSEKTYGHDSIKCLQNRKSYLYSQMKKAQDSMRKSLRN